MTNSNIPMNEKMLTPELKRLIRGALERSWSKQTSVCFDPTIAPLSYGQCAQTAIVLYENYGGRILKTTVAKHDGSTIRHFYNEIAGERVDFTADQFDIPDYWRELTYADIQSSVEDAYTELMPGQIEAMRKAFHKALEGWHDA